jgi:transcriptional regulator with XRE-family HTH domain
VDVDLDAPALGEALRSYRTTHAMTQLQLARRLRVTQQTVARWEGGAPPRSSLVPVILAELGVAAAAPALDDLAEVIPMRATTTTAHPSGSTVSLRHEFLVGCIRRLQSGKRLPDQLLLAIAAELGMDVGPRLSSGPTRSRRGYRGRPWATSVSGSRWRSSREASSSGG